MVKNADHQTAQGIGRMDKAIEIIMGNAAIQWTAIAIAGALTLILLILFIQYNIDRARGRHAKFFWVEVNATKDPIPQPYEPPSPTITGKNINTGTNHGSIGDHYSGLKQRNITQEDIDSISAEINEFSRRHADKINKSHLTIGYPMCKETTNLANQIYPHLQKMGYPKIIGMFLQSYGSTGKMLGVSYAPDNSLMVEIYPPDNVE